LEKAGGKSPCRSYNGQEHFEDRKEKVCIWRILYFYFLYNLHDKWVLGASSVPNDDRNYTIFDRMVLTGKDSYQTDGRIWKNVEE